jgi:thymidylate kinase
MRRLVEIIIAIEGVDGSGKSTQSAMVYESLVDSQVNAEYIRPIFYLMSFFKNEKEWHFSPRLMRTGSRHSVSPLIKIGGVIYAIITFAILKIKGRNRILICDRYFFQFFFDLFGNSSRRIVSIFPKPDLTFYLDLDPDLIYARVSGSDAEINRDYYKNVVLYYRDLSVTYGFIKIDATGDRFQTQKLILDKISSFYKER